MKKHRKPTIGLRNRPIAHATKGLFSICCLILLFAAVHGYEKDNISKLNLAVWQDRDGLPQNTIQSIEQTSDGYLWLGTEVGLARFDGIRFEVFNTHNTPALKNNYVTALHESSDKTLWIGTRGGGVTKLTSGGFTTFSANEGLSQDTVRAIGEGADGAMWIGTNRGLFQYKDGVFKVFGEKEGLPSGNIRAIFLDGEKRLWIGSTEGMSLFDGEKFETFDLPESISSDTTRAIMADGDGALWIGTQTAGLLRFRDGKFENYTTKNGLTSNFVRSLHTDQDGNLWIGTFGGGLNRFRDGKFSNFTSRDGLTSDIIRAIYSDREGNLWIGTEGGGLNRLNIGKARTLSTNDGLSHQFIRAVRQMRDGKMWIGTEGGGVNVLENGRVVKVFSTSNGLSNNFITSIYELTSGAVWVGTLEGLNVIENGKVRQISRRDGLGGTTVWTVHQTSDGAVWVGTAGGLSRFHNGTAKNFTIMDGLPESNIRVLHEDRSGRLLIATREGSLARFENGEFTVLQSRGPAWNKIISAFYEDPEGIIWMASNDGLIRFKNDEFHSFTSADGLFHDNLHQVVEDSDGNLWLGSSGGIFSVSKQDLHNFTEGNIRRLSTVSLTAADGMKSSECTGEAQPAGWRTDSGEIWFPTIRGVAIVDPKQIRFNELPPPVQIQKVVLERETVDHQQTLEFPAGAKELEFHYTALSFSAPENVRFKYRLEGLEQDWVDAGTRRTAFYTSLPPGNYRFQVIASNNDGVWNETGAGFEFYQRPFFYQTKTFLLISLLFFGLLVWLVYRWRVSQIKQRFEAVSTERNRIAREWHDTLSAGIAAIAWQLESSIRQFSDSPSVARQNLEIALKMVKHSMTEARRVLWDLRSNSADNADLASTLGESVKRIASGKTVKMDYQVEGDPLELPGDVSGNLVRICQEAVSNAVAHAKARQVSVSLFFTPQRVSLQIADDGCGFDPQKPSADGIGHFGLIGMQERAVKVGGKFDIKSILGKGTQILIEVPLK